MNNQFLSQTVHFIEKSDLEILSPSVRKLTLTDNNGRHIDLGIVEMFGNQTQLKNNFILSQLTIFTLFDSLIDIKYPDLEGLSFRKRYQGLPNNNKLETIQREIYRLFKVIRNSMIHARDSIDLKQKKLEIDYFFNRTNFKLKGESSILTYINTLAFYLVKCPNVTDAYFQTFMINYYVRLTEKITDFSDEFGCEIIAVTSELNIKEHVRYRVDVEVNGDNSIQLPNVELDEKEYWAGIDYVINHGNDLFIVPSESIINLIKPSINLTDIYQWKIGKYNIFAK